jgi:hypothetical protein
VSCQVAIPGREGILMVYVMYMCGVWLKYMNTEFSNTESEKKLTVGILIVLVVVLNSETG